MACGSFVGQCLEGSADCPDRTQCPVCCNPFAAIYGFSEVDTGGGFPGCFVGIFNDGNSPGREISDGRWCAPGCAGSVGDTASCDDGQLRTFADALDGKRFLRPVSDDPTAHTLDAFGMLHDLESNTYWPVPRGTSWERGSCWYNDGRECFGTDACACWDKGRFFETEEGGNCSGIRAGEPLDFILPDPMMRTGWGWPPTARMGTNSIRGNDFYCRRFADARFGLETRPGRLDIGTPVFGGQPGLNEPMLGPITVSQLECSANYMVPCAALIEKPPVQGDGGQFEDSCFTAVWFERGPGSPRAPDNDLYYLDGAAGSVVRRRFDQLIVSRGTDPPRIADCTDASPLQRGTIDLKNRIIDYVLTNPIDGINFDRLDHLQAGSNSNSGLGKYRRRWSGSGIEVPGVFGACRLQESGCPVTCRLMITSVAVHAMIVLQALKPTSLPSLSRSVDPLITFMLVVGLEVRTELPGPCELVSWDGRRTTLILNGVEVLPPIDRIEFVGVDGAPVQIPKTVEWRGLLGGHSRPSSRDFRRFVGGEQDAAFCEVVADAVQDIPVPGWPMRADSTPDNPQGTYAGSAILGFRL